ncbi:MAG: hypothetical protein V7736_17400 [Colwellia polaris]|jgi:hypothetical protein|uniref:hypothetical protein n=1 Tax=Colwellia polaris TaxID=326537 RepID=UPI000A175EA3|nr:hypothetical protein [Colwellia polaris]|tara:strand:+ start:9610 stop:10029 length:420 start_codon:yes stop_codon:yes gene_type:complete
MNVMLIVAGTMSLIAAALHLGCIYFGASWYRLFGAGEHMALMAEQGSIKPTLITLSITLVLMTWSLYAFSAAGAIIKLPFIRVILMLITAIYIFRGVAGYFFMNTPLGRTPEFWIWSLSICLIIGLVHLIGLKQARSTL